MDKLVYKEIDNEIVSIYELKDTKKKKLLKRMEIQVFNSNNQDICRIKIYATFTILDNTIFIEYPNNEINIEYENTLNDDYSVFLVKQNGSNKYKDRLLEVYINVYKKTSSASNKKLYATGEIIIDNKGGIRYGHA